MRIAHFIHRYPPALGGAEAYFARLSRFLAARGDHVTVFTSNALDLTAFWSWRGRCLPAGESRDEGVTVRRYSLWRFPGRRYVLKLLSLIPNRRWQGLTLPCNPISWDMWRESHSFPNSSLGTRSGPFDLVHATAFPYAFPMLCGLRLARQLKVPFFLTPFLHLGDPDNPRDSTRAAYTSPALMSLLHAADGIFVQTDGERGALLERGIDADKIVLQGLGVDPADCTGGERRRARQRWDIDDDVPVVGHLANNSEEKGTVDLLRAAAMLWERRLKFRVVLAGPQMPNFLRFWKNFHPAKNVRCLGQLSEQEKKDFFAGLDLFALPSRVDSFGLVLLEAWVNGKPNLAYRAGGIADVIRHGSDGLLTRCGDIPALAAALAALVTNPALRRSLGETGRQRALTEYRWIDKLQLVRSTFLQKAQLHANQLPHPLACV